MVYIDFRLSTSAPAIFLKKIMDNVLQRIPGTLCYIDDIFISVNIFKDASGTQATSLKN